MGDAREEAHARSLALDWAPPSLPELLQLLGHRFVRGPFWKSWLGAFVVSRLDARRLADGDLIEYLLPLVQATRCSRDAAEMHSRDAAEMQPRYTGACSSRRR